MTTANVIQLDPNREPSFRFKGVRRGICIHRMFTIDDASRIIQCRECGSIVDPFDALVSIATDWARHTENLRHCAKESREIEERLKELKRVERNAKARVRRLEAGKR